MKAFRPGLIVASRYTPTKIFVKPANNNPCSIDRGESLKYWEARGGGGGAAGRNHVWGPGLLRKSPQKPGALLPPEILYPNTKLQP